MKLTLTFDSVEEMEAFCRDLAGKKCTVGAESAVVNAATSVQAPMSTQMVVQAPIAQPVQQSAMTGTAPMGMPVAQQPIQQVPVQQPAMAAPVQNVVPTTAVAQEFSYDQLAVAAAGLMNAGKGAQLHAILQQFGVQAMTELPKERYGEFATAIRAEGAVI